MQVTTGRLFAGVAGALLVGAPVVGGLSLPSPAAAQMMGAGYKFLEAVRKRDGAEVEKALGPTGSSTIVNTQDVTTGDTALHIITQRRDLDWLRYMLVQGADPNKANSRGVRALGLAVGLGWAEGAQMLLKNGARPDEPGVAGETPLIAAVHQRDVEMVRLLLRAGANPLRADNSGRSAKDYAQLIGGESAIATEIAAAAKDAAARKKQTYGPSF